MMRGWTRRITAGLSALLGAWMAFDGARALFPGDYVTPASGPHAGQLGPWASVVEAVGLAPRSEPVMFALLVIGLLWVGAAGGVLTRALWARRAIGVVVPLGVWYAPFGTVIALTVFVLVLIPPRRGEQAPSGPGLSSGPNPLSGEAVCDRFTDGRPRLADSGGFPRRPTCRMAVRPLSTAVVRLPVAIVLAALIAPSGCAQSTRSGSPVSRSHLFDCEGCEATTERGPEGLSSTLALAPASEAGARLVLSGRVLRPDGQTPAPGVVLYLHQTDASGIYRPAPGAAGWARRHGRLRGWLVSGTDGSYRIDTVRPGPYPGRDVPAHVHVFVKEPDRPPYYLHDFVFDDDPLVTDAYRATLTDRTDPGVVHLTRAADGSWNGHRDLLLER